MTAEASRGGSETRRCSIIIPVFNKAAITKQCIQALLADPPETTTWEIVVVDDGSRDETPRILEQFSDQIRVVRHDQNAGFAATCNDGAAASEGEYIVFLNNDILPQRGWLDNLVRYADQHPGAAAVGSKLLFANDTIQHAGAVVSWDGFPRHAYTGFPADHPAVNKSRRFQIVTGACMLVRRAAFEQVGGFDTQFVNAYEDSDLCLRLGELGHEIHYCHESVLYHFESVSREGRIADLEHSTKRFRERWADRLEPDDFRYYLEDGLISVQYGQYYPFQLSLSPLLAVVDDSERRRAIEHVLLLRKEQVFDLLRQNLQLQMQQWQTTLKNGGRSDDALSPSPRDANTSNDRPDARAADDVLTLREQVLALEARCASEESVGKTRLYQLRESERAVSAYRQAAEERLQLIHHQLRESEQAVSAYRQAAEERLQLIHRLEEELKLCSAWDETQRQFPNMEALLRQQEALIMRLEQAVSQRPSRWRRAYAWLKSNQGPWKIFDSGTRSSSGDNGPIHD